MAFALRACEHADRQSKLVGVTVAQNGMAFLLPHTAMCWVRIALAKAKLRFGNRNWDMGTRPARVYDCYEAMASLTNWFRSESEVVIGLREDLKWSTVDDFRK